MAKNLSQLPTRELRRFLGSFDVVLSDCDGVLWIFNKLIPGALESLKTLQDLGKKIQLVSNNSTQHFSQYAAKVKNSGLKFQPSQLMIPSIVITWYLNKVNFRDEAFVIGSPGFRKTLEEGGIKMTPPDYPPVYEEDNAKSAASVTDIGSSRAIILEFSVKANWAQMAYAINRLKTENLLYMTGTKTKWVVAGPRKEVLGAGPLIDIVTEMSGKKPIECAKPSTVLRDYIMDVCQLKDPKRCLFIGDTISTDMAFADQCGFQKLFVETGMNSYQDASKNEKNRPDYYLSSLGALTSIVESEMKI